MRNLTRIISGFGLAILTVAMLTVAPGWAVDNPEAVAAAAKCAADAERGAASCEANSTPGTDLNYCLQRVQNRYNNCMGSASLKQTGTVKRLLETSPGLLDTLPGLSPGGPAGAGRPIAPTAPAAPPPSLR